MGFSGEEIKRRRVEREKQAAKATEKTIESREENPKKTVSEPIPKDKLIICPVCGKQISPNATSCPHCGEPLPKKPSEREKRGKGCAAGCFTLIFVYCIGALIYGYFHDENATVTDGRKLKNSAFAICKNSVERSLKSPSTANFPFLDFTAGYLGNNTWQIRSYVDAQNGFGATIRSNWVCKAKYTGGESFDDRNWQILKLDIK